MNGNNIHQKHEFAVTDGGILRPREVFYNVRLDRAFSMAHETISV